MSTITMKKIRKVTRSISRAFFTISVSIIAFWVVRYDFCVNHSAEIFTKAFIASMVFFISSLIVSCIGTIIQSYINSRYRKVHIEEQELQLLIEDVRMRTVLR